MLSFFVAALFGMSAVQASPTLYSRDTVSPLTSTQIDAFTPYINYAKATYCPPETVASWTCGAACSANSGFQLVAHGGDGDGVQYWYVGYAKDLDTVVVAHQGTNTSQTKALLTDADTTRGDLDRALFPKIPDGIEVHNGFREDHAKTALVILTAVQSAMKKYNTASLTLVGHSLGAALAALDGAFLYGRLSSTPGFKLRAYTFGQPRVGNQKFADYLDSFLPLTRITNQKDPIPIVPGQNLGYVHPSGEVHIQDTEAWAACSGQENYSTQCIDGEVSNIFKGDEKDHDGPYNGILLGHCD